MSGSSAKQASQDKSSAVKASSLGLSDLGAVKKQLDEEIEQLTTSFSRLHAAQAKFRECLKSVVNGVETVENDQVLLIPLTTSLYVPGKLRDREHVIVDVGTGYYVEKTTEDAKDFYSRKIDDLTGNLKELEKILQNRDAARSSLTEVMRQKIAADGNPKAESA